MRRPSRRGIAAAIIFGAVLVGANVWAASSDAVVDLSANRRFSLTAESRALARAVDADLDVTVFVYEEGGAARDARFLLNRYRDLNGRIDYRIVDPDEQPAEAARYGITGYSTAVYEYRGRRLETTSVNELQVSTTILRLLRGGSSTACFLTGHGEPALDDRRPDGLSSLGTLLGRNGYDVEPLDLRRGGEVPARCDVVAVVAPRVALLPDEVSALLDHTERAGRLAVLASPFFQEADPNPLLNPWGIAFAGGLAVDPDRSESADVSNVVVSEFPTTNPVVDGVPSLQFPAPGGLLVDDLAADGLTVSRLAVTSAGGFVETKPDTELEFSDGDIPGPVVLAAAADDSRVEDAGDDGDGARIVRTRVFATGNSLWASNDFLDRLGNRRFAVNAFNWLAEQEQLLTVGAQPPQPRELVWTRERERRVAAVAIGLVPGGVVAAGIVQWLVRRRVARRVAMQS